MRDDVPDVPVDRPVSSGVASLDMTTFAQLIAAIQQAGLSLNIDAIHSVCEHEFRAGRYRRAYGVIEGIYVQINAQSQRREGELRRQEMQYKSGALKMSPKEWMLRQRRETEKTQHIDRARRHCSRILSGLNSLAAAQAEEASEENTPETPAED
jgi:hypothetical protein